MQAQKIRKKAKIRNLPVWDLKSHIVVASHVRVGALERSTADEFSVKYLSFYNVCEQNSIPSPSDLAYLGTICS